MKLEIEAGFWKEGSQYVGRANPLNILSCGDTREEAEHALTEALELFLETAHDMGTLEDILLECGFTPVGDLWAAPAKPERRSLQLEI
jgi:predicted RNase H-like HicB family nuclease